MNINLTLVVQAANFGIAYWLLSTLLFKPVVKILHAREEWRHAMADSIAQVREKSKQTELAVRKHWQETVTEFRQHYPPGQLSMVFTFPEIPSISLTPVPPKPVMDSLVHDVEVALVARMSHVRI